MRRYISLIVTLSQLLSCGPQSVKTEINQQDHDVDAKDYRRAVRDQEKEENCLKIESPKLNKENKQKLIELAKKVAPELREHKNEKYPLTSVGAYLSEVGLAYYHDGQREVLIEPGQATMGNLKDTAKNKGIPILANNFLDAVLDAIPDKLPKLRNNDLRFFIPQQDQKVYDRIAASKINKAGQKNEPICYAYAHYVKNYRDVGSGEGSDERQAIEIVYIFFNA